MSSKTKIEMPVEPLIAQIERKVGVSRTEALAAVEGLEAFLNACAESTDTLSPSPLVDEAWHAFILETEAYEAYCMERYGFFIHHKPMPPNQEAYDRARRIVGGAGQLDPAIWPEAGGAPDCERGCGGGPPPDRHALIKPVSDCRSACGGQKIE